MNADKPQLREGNEHLTLFYLISEKNRREAKASLYLPIGEELRFMED